MASKGSLIAFRIPASPDGGPGDLARLESFIPAGKGRNSAETLRRLLDYAEQYREERNKAFLQVGAIRKAYRIDDSELVDLGAVRKEARQVLLNDVWREVKRMRQRDIKPFILKLRDSV